MLLQRTMPPPTVVPLPTEAEDPAAHCQRWAALQKIVREDVPAPAPPVLWLCRQPGQLARGICGVSGHEDAVLPLWWAGDEWREFPPQIAAHAASHTAYVPRRFAPTWHSGGGLLQPVEAPLDAGPEDGHAPAYSESNASAASALGSGRRGMAPAAAALLALAGGAIGHGSAYKPPATPSSPSSAGGDQLNKGFAFGSGGGAGVVRVLRALLCERQGKLWARPQTGGHWVPCPYELGEFSLCRTEAFEVCDGDRYVLLLREAVRRGGGGGPDVVVMYDAAKNRWLSPAGPARSSVGGHAGDPPVRWRPVDGFLGASPRRQPQHLQLRAWVVEATSDWLVLLAPVSRDGFQRGSGQDLHSAVHFFGRDGEVVTHHLACSPFQLTLQRYDDHVLVVRDAIEHPAGPSDCILDDNWHPSDPLVAGWLLACEDVAVPPLPVHLPRQHEAWGGASTSWSLALARGRLEEMAVAAHLRVDMATRLYLLEAGPDALRLWASRRVDDAHSTRFERHTFDGVQHLRHALSFEPLLRTELALHSEGHAADAAPANHQAPALWSPDLRYVMRIAGGRGGATGGTRPMFWRCGVAYDGNASGFKARAPRAHGAPTDTVPSVSTAEVLPLKPMSWAGEMGLPSELCRGGVVVDGLPSFPRLRWGEADFHRPEDRWFHPVGRDSAQQPPTAVLR